MRFPVVYDSDTKKGSVTLLFAYIAFVLAISAVIFLIIENRLQGAIAAIANAIVFVVLYRIRKIDKFSISKDEITIDADDEDVKEEINEN